MPETFYHKSPIGILEINLENNKITEIKIVKTIKKDSLKSTYFKEITTQLDEYFLGKRINFELDIFPKGTDFQKSVWKELLKIPYGKTKSYKDIAYAINKPNAQRAVGSACNKNPILIIIPCHRVISKTKALTGFSYGIDKKRQLLELEARKCH